MKLNKMALFVGVGMVLFAGSALADDTIPQTDHTHVYFDGTITNAPCSMPNTSRDQHVPMGSIAAHTLKDGGTSDPQAFHFDLKDCPAGSTVSVTFGGASDPNAKNDKTMLSLGSGAASGAGIQILADGNPVTLGKANSKQNLTEGDNTLTFAAQLKGDEASVTTGDFSAVSDVTFNYE